MHDVPCTGSHSLSLSRIFFLLPPPVIQTHGRDKFAWVHADRMSLPLTHPKMRDAKVDANVEVDAVLTVLAGRFFSFLSSPSRSFFFVLNACAEYGSTKYMFSMETRRSTRLRHSLAKSRRTSRTNLRLLYVFHFLLKRPLRLLKQSHKVHHFSSSIVLMGPGLLTRRTRLLLYDASPI